MTASCASSYNVAAPARSTFSSQTAEKVFDVATVIAANKEVASFYFIPENEEQDVDVEFHLLKQTIESVPLVANFHVYLQGDLSESNPKWGATSEYAQKQIDFFFKKEDGTSEGTLCNGVYQFYLPPGNIADLEAVLSAIFHKNVELDLTKNRYIFEEVLDNDYTFAVRNNPTSKVLDILINNNKAFNISYEDWNNRNDQNFSVVSDKLKNQTE